MTEPLEDYDRLRRRVLWSMPSGLYVVGSAADERLNAMTMNLAMQVSIDPKRIGIAVARDAYTHQLISEGGVFVLNILTREDRAIVRKFVKPVAVDKEAMALNGFAYRIGKTGSPILTQAQAFIDCRVSQAFNTGDHTLFIGDVVDAAFQGPETSETLRMEDTRMNYGG